MIFFGSEMTFRTFSGSLPILAETSFPLKQWWWRCLLALWISGFRSGSIWSADGVSRREGGRQVSSENPPASKLHQLYWIDLHSRREDQCLLSGLPQDGGGNLQKEKCKWPSISGWEGHSCPLRYSKLCCNQFGGWLEQIPPTSSAYWNVLTNTNNNTQEIFPFATCWSLAEAANEKGKVMILKIFHHHTETISY